MSIVVHCPCGRILKARPEFAGRRAECPTCGRSIQIPAAGDLDQAAPTGAAAPPLEITEFFDPPAETAASAGDAAKIPVLRRMFEALLDPRSIQWMLMIGGGLSVLGLIVWLVSLGVFEDPRILAVALIEREDVFDLPSGHHGDESRVVDLLADDVVSHQQPLVFGMKCGSFHENRANRLNGAVVKVYRGRGWQLQTVISNRPCSHIPILSEVLRSDVECLTLIAQLANSLLHNVMLSIGLVNQSKQYACIEKIRHQSWSE